MASKGYEPVFWKDFTAGYLGGIVNILAGQPFDIVKVRLQTSGGGSMVSVFKNVIKVEGMSALWKGSSFPLIFYGLCSSVMFPVKEKIGHLFKNNKDEKLKYWQLYVAGGMGGVAQGFISCPMEHIRIRMQIQTPTFSPYKNSLDCFLKIFKEHGVAGVYKGFTLTMMREFFLYGAYFGVYDIVSQKLPGTNPVLLAIIGGLSGMTAWLHGGFIDTLKSKMQADNLSSPKYPSLISLKSELGFSTLSRGFGAGLSRAFFVNVPTFAAYEIAQKCLYSKKTCH